MLNFVEFHLFPVLNVLANDIRVTSGELGKSWDSMLAVLPRSGLLPWTLMSDSRNEMLPPLPETNTTERINTLSSLFHWCFPGDYTGWVLSRFSLIFYSNMPLLSNTVKWMWAQEVERVVLLSERWWSSVNGWDSECKAALMLHQWSRLEKTTFLKLFHCKSQFIIFVEPKPHYIFLWHYI